MGVEWTMPGHRTVAGCDGPIWEMASVGFNTYVFF